MASYLIRVGDALSQLLNVLIFNGDSNHSISGDAYRLKRTRLMRFIDWLASPWEDYHCQLAYEHDVQKAIYLLAERRNSICAS
jgi:hypothetical protein